MIPDFCPLRKSWTANALKLKDIYCGTYTTQAMQICYHLIDGVYRGIDINQIKVLKPIKLHELLQQWNKPLFTPEVEVYLRWIALCLNNGCHPPNTQRHLLVVPGTYFLYSNTPLMWRTRVPQSVESYCVVYIAYNGNCYSRFLPWVLEALEGIRI